MLLLPLGLFLGLLLSQWALRSDVSTVAGREPGSDRGTTASVERSGSIRFQSFGRWLLGAQVRDSLWPILSLSIGVWLPAALCIYREAPDWSFLYLLPPDRATPVFLASIFTVITVSLPVGFGLGLFLQHQRARRSASSSQGVGHSPGLGQMSFWRLLPWLLLSLLALLIGVALRVGSDRLLWVGSYADFHDGRWLLVPLWSNSPGSLRLLGILVVAFLTVAAGCLVTIRALTHRHGGAGRAFSDESPVSSPSFLK